MVGVQESLPAGYGDWLAELKSKVRQARLQASLAVNSELIGLYWRIGRNILDRQQRDGWGGKVVQRLATDLRAARRRGIPDADCGRAFRIAGRRPAHSGGDRDGDGARN
jgi:hypothetical protein